MTKEIIIESRIYELLESDDNLTQEEEFILFQYYKNHPSIELRNQIVIKNNGLVKKFSKKYSYFGIDNEELIQEATFGLITAVEHFDPGKGNKFSTYAFYWITHSMSRYILNNRHAIRLPVYLGEKFLKITCVQKEYKKTHGEYPSYSYIAKGLDMTEEEIRQIISSCSLADPVSLNTSVSYEDESNTELMDFIMDDQTKSVEDSAITAITSKDIRRIMKKSLTEKEIKVITMRFGLSGNVPMTLERVSQEFSVTRERIRQIERNALRKLGFSREIRQMK